MTDDFGQGQSPPVRLRIVRSAIPSLVGREYELVGRETRLGRAPENDIAIADLSVSGRHARLEVTESGEFMLYDDGSSNGIVFDGQRVDEVEIVPGQRFTLGSTTFQLVDLLESPPPEPTRVQRTMIVTGLHELAKEFELPQAFEELGESFTTEANRPFLISDPTAMWLVESGKVELFTIGLEAGAPVGARTHFITVEPGAAFLGLDADSAGYDSGFLASGRAGSELRRFDIERLRVVALVPEHRARLTQVIVGWVTALSRRLTQDLAKIPDADLVLRAGEEAELKPEVVTGSGNQIVWIELPAAHYLFDDMASLSYEAEGVFFPLAPGSWLELLVSDGPLKVVPKTTEEIIADPRLWAGLDIFHRLLMECELLNKRLALVDEADRLARKAERRDAAHEAGVAEIEAVLGGSPKWDRSAIGTTDLDTVLEACRLVAQGSGIEIRRPSGEVDEFSFEEIVLAVAGTSRFRTRRVALVDDWWNRDQGPLLAQREEGETPVALVPSGTDSYDSVDTTTGERQGVTEEIAATLTPFAYSFYRPFPDGPLGAKDLVRYSVRGLKREFREVIAMGIAVGLFGTASPFITGMVFDSAIPQAERGSLQQFCIGLFLVALGTSAFKITQNVAMLRVQGKMDYSAQAAIWDRLLNLRVGFYRRFSAGDLSDRAAAIDSIRSIVAGTGVSAILGAFASSFNAVQMGFYSLQLAGVAIVLTLVYVALTTICNLLKLRLERKELFRRGRITGLVLQLITGVAKLRVSGTEDHAFRVWATQFAAMRRTAFRVGRISNFMPMLNGGFPIISSLLIFLTMVKMQENALEKGQAFDLSTGDFLAFNAAYGIFLGAMQTLGDASVSLLGILPVFERLKPILEEKPEVDASKEAPSKLKGGIELSHVSFRYDENGPWILNDLSLKIEPGDFVAIVGGSGSGKSTLMKVMLGFETPDKGTMYFDGQDLSTLDVRLVRQQIGVVLQESRLLPADVYRNIVGSSSRTIADAWEAAERAGLADDIKRMPMGMHTYISEGGGGFSGGQRQRLMIARALVHNPKILFLDEATSALDNRTQTIVTESMDRLQATRIVIAHRLSTIVNANRICYLDQGVVVEQGTYDELLALDGLFAELAKRQLA